jgi:WD40 repeat protein
MIAPATEKLTAIRHSNNRDWWVIAHRWNSNAYIAYLVTEEGVNMEPVMTNVGTVHGGAHRKAIGYLVPSPDGTLLAAALWDSDSNFEVLRFDRSTGEVSDPILLKGYEEAYGVCFSPDGTKLYGTANGRGGGKAQIIQFDLLAGDEAAIAKSAVVVGTSGSPRIGALQLGPDGRMYVARQDNIHLGVISQPNLLGKASGYVDTGMHLGGRKSDLGLPNFPQGIRSSTGRSANNK